ncbi:MAG: hypothetical protein IRY92_06690 [Dactylosporangium sp.]|nr:hypothetical protein [Dactylosporangium sp.]
MAATEVTMRTLDLPLPGNRVLRLALTLDAFGEPEDLVIACGFQGGARLRDLAEGGCLPASAIAGLRDALAGLERASR